ncbi:MAG: hypothetical protein P1P87_07465 [Trueperaceae bacterium]|nr:hypothetical protein [Trueperaceae bacterium]
MTSSPSPSPSRDDGASVRFVELAGTDATRVLRALAADWRAAGAAVELLASTDQPDLWLLVARGGDPGAGPAAPTGARVWRFRSVGP